MSDVVRTALASVIDGGTLSLDEARDAMGAVMDGEATSAQLAALLVALRMRGETVDELAGFATAMRERVIQVDAPPDAIDMCGTGGDGSRTFNISTAAALVVAATGVPVAKHGNRAITSASGSADVLDALGVRIDHDAVSAGVALRVLGFAFLFAPGFHPAMKHAGPTRKEIGVRTAFNLIGPLTNPAGARRQVVGVADPAVAPRVAEVLRTLGAERALVVPGAGIDELPLDGSGVIYDVRPDGVERRTVDSDMLGLAAASVADLAGSSPGENAATVESVLRGIAGAASDVVMLNAAAGLIAAGRVETLAAGLAVAAQAIERGAAGELLDRLRAERRSAEVARGQVDSPIADAAAPAQGAPA